MRSRYLFSLLLASTLRVGAVPVQQNVGNGLEELIVSAILKEYNVGQLYCNSFLNIAPHVISSTVIETTSITTTDLTTSVDTVVTATYYLEIQL
jgi:hypothetical protein